MKALTRSLVLLVVLMCIFANVLAPCLLRAQPSLRDASSLTIPPLATSEAQRKALNAVRSQVDWFRNATRIAPSYVTGSYDNIWQQFQMLRGAYDAFKATLTPNQLKSAGNELAELEAGLDILQEAFDEYQQDVAAGRSPIAALRSMCQALDEAAGVWLQELNKTAMRLRVWI
jgi:hypothetical protein